MPTRPLTLLRLCRFPTVFTALADIAAGFLLTHSSLEPVSTFLLLLLASAGLYLSGMVFNDVFDVAQDSRERPKRPIPSGAISRSAAAGFGILLMLAGIVSAGFAGLPSLGIALLLAANVLAYDGWLKRTPFGPVAMGSCRFFNLLLGASGAALQFSGIWQWPQLWVALSMGVYIAGVTWFARTEAKESHRSALSGALTTVNLGLLLLATWISDVVARLFPGFPLGAAETWRAMVIWGVIAFTINRRGMVAVANPTPAHVQPVIGTMLLSVIMLDALTIYTQHGVQGIPYVLGTIALILPAMLLRRWIALT